MDKFSYGQYDSTVTTGSPFNDSSYVQIASEQEARKQLGYPLKEISDYVNNTVPIKNVDSVEKAIQLKLTDDNLLQYSLDGTTFYDTASSGHQIYDEDGTAYAQKTKLKFVNADVSNSGDFTIVETDGHKIYDEDETAIAQKSKLMFKNTNVYNSGDYTVVEGIQGSAGVSVASMVQVEQSSASGGNNKWRATLSNGTTYDFIVKNGLQGETGATGPQGNGLVILGTYASLEDLQTAHPTGNEGDIYSVGTSSEANPNYVWDTDDEAWESIGKTRGEKGAKGDTGEQGATGNGIQSIVVTESSVSGGNNVVTITMTGGQVYTFNVKNGEQGAAGTGVPTGGSIGQHLIKRTSIDYDMAWADVPTVDQTYSPSSTNAQSGVAVASGISSAIDQTYGASSTNAQSGVAVASGISSYDNYTTLSVAITGWTSSTLESETVYTKELTLSGATSGKHPIVSCVPTKPSTMDDENEMFSQIIKVEEGSNTLTITSSAIPTTAYTLQVKNY